MSLRSARSGSWQLMLRVASVWWLMSYAAWLIGCGDVQPRLRPLSTEAVILAFSASLDPATLKELLGAGCNGVCDKKVPSDMPEMLAALDRCLGKLEEGRKKESATRGNYLVSTFRELFQEWNRRLDSQE